MQTVVEQPKYHLPLRVMTTQSPFSSVSIMKISEHTFYTQGYNESIPFSTVVEKVMADMMPSPNFSFITALNGYP